MRYTKNPATTQTTNRKQNQTFRFLAILGGMVALSCCFISMKMNIGNIIPKPTNSPMIRELFQGYFAPPHCKAIKSITTLGIITQERERERERERRYLLDKMHLLSSGSQGQRHCIAAYSYCLCFFLWVDGAYFVVDDSRGFYVEKQGIVTWLGYYKPPISDRTGIYCVACRLITTFSISQPLWRAYGFQILTDMIGMCLDQVYLAVQAVYAREDTSVRALPC